MKHEERRVANQAKSLGSPRVLSLVEHINHLLPELAARPADLDGLPLESRRRRAFSGFLRNLCTAAEDVNGSLINRFLRRAARWPEWNRDLVGLASEAHSLIEHWSRTHGVHPDLKGALRADHIQAVEVQSPALAEELIRAALDRKTSAGDKVRVVHQADRDRWVAVRLRSDQTLEVRIFSRLFLLSQGSVEPLISDYSLRYDASLQMLVGTAETHELPMDDGQSSARFQLTPDGGLIGAMVSGPTFERRFGLDGAELGQYPEVFYALKRLETLYVARQSDPTYRELLSILEKAVDLIDRGHPEALKFARAAHHRGLLAMKYIYCDAPANGAGLAADRGDKLVRILLGSLEKSLALGELER